MLLTAATNAAATKERERGRWEGGGEWGLYRRAGDGEVGERWGKKIKSFFFMCLCRAALPAAPAAHNTGTKKDQKAKKSPPPPLLLVKLNVCNSRTDGGGRAEVRYRACLPPPNQKHIIRHNT